MYQQEDRLDLLLIRRQKPMFNDRLIVAGWRHGRVDVCSVMDSTQSIRCIEEESRSPDLHQTPDTPSLGGDSHVVLLAATSRCGESLPTLRAWQEHSLTHHDTRGCRAGVFRGVTAQSTSHLALVRSSRAARTRPAFR